MNAKRLVSISDESGRIKVDVLGAPPNRRIEVFIVWQEMVGVAAVRGGEMTPGSEGWPAGFFEQTFGALRDVDFERPPQPGYDEIEPHE